MPAAAGSRDRSEQQARHSEEAVRPQEAILQPGRGAGGSEQGMGEGEKNQAVPVRILRRIP